MKLKTVFIIDAIIAALFGAAALIAPGPLTASPGMETDALGLYFLRGYGAGLLSVGVMMWLARNSGPSSARTALPVGFVLWVLIDAVKEVWALLTGLLPGGEWL